MLWSNWEPARMDRPALSRPALSIAIYGGILRFQEAGKMIDARSEVSEKIILNQRDER